MTRPERKKELEKQFHERQRLYEEALEEHPATKLISMINRTGVFIAHPSSFDEAISDAVTYLLERARDDDVGAR